ncbi:MAG: hypothetical protein ACRD1T_02165, partial [Acidimicrobiia bacterium]
MPARRGPEASLYRRNAIHVTTQPVLHVTEKEAEILEVPRLRRKRVRMELEKEWSKIEGEAAAETRRVIETLQGAADVLEESLRALGTQKIPELLGKVEGEQFRVRSALKHLQDARDSLSQKDCGSAGTAVDGAGRELWLVGGPFVVTLNQLLSQAAVGREQRLTL